MAIPNNFLKPATGAVAPTAAQLLQSGERLVIFKLVTDGALTTFTINHNLGVSAGDLLLGLPTVMIEPQSAAAANGTVAAFVASKTANTVVLTFLAVAGTYDIVIDARNTAGR